MLGRNKAVLTRIMSQRHLSALKHKVFIRDILVTQARIDDRQNRVGEFESKNENNETDAAFAQRIVPHIKKMALFAAQIHLDDNFHPADPKACNSAFHYPHVDWTPDVGQDSSSTSTQSPPASKDVRAMKDDCRNKVTRLSFIEYYFYPSKKCGPLQLSTFIDLMDHIEKIAFSLPDNLHLTLASFPVLDSQNRVSNMVIYVQCGATPTVQTFAKATPSNNEPIYKKTENVEFCASPLSPTYQIALGHAKSEKSSLNFSSPILCKTPDTAFWTAIDVCADHEIGAAQQAFDREIASRLSTSTEIIPEQMSHIVTSNSTFIYNEKKLSDTVTHADPSYHTLHTTASNVEWQSNMTKAIGTNGVDQVEIRVFPQRAVETFNSKLLTSVQSYNRNLATRLADQIALNASQTMQPLQRAIVRV
jgi:hypothetical protein